jgi:pimeloyl-ACP methyl ester carboxylesterase
VSFDMPYINIGEIELFYNVHGEGEPLVLIHGLGSSTRDWELQLTPFTKHFQVITLDLRGHGKSSKPAGPYSMEMLAKDTAQLIQQLKLKSGHILGISLGGMVAFQLVLDYPHLVRSLVITNSTVDMVPKSIKERLAIWQRVMIVRLMGMEKMGQVLADRFMPHPEQKELREVFIQRWGENDKTAYLEALKGIVGWSVKDRLAEIKCPALIIGADGDYFPVEEKEAYVSMIPNSKLVIVENSRHALPAERPEDFNNIVLGFLLELS